MYLKCCSIFQYNKILNLLFVAQNVYNSSQINPLYKEFKVAKKQNKKL